MHFRRSTNNHIGRNAIHRVRISSLANADNTPVFDANIRFHDAPMVENNNICYQKIQNTLVPTRRRRLSHTITNGFTATEFTFVAIDREVFFNFNNQFSIAQTDAIARRWTEHIGVFSS